jgi:hypothetical protein
MTNSVVDRQSRSRPVVIPTAGRNLLFADSTSAAHDSRFLDGVAASE